MADNTETAAPVPANGVDAKQELDGMAKEAKRGGAQFYDFDPDASPEEKMAQAKKVWFGGHPRTCCSLPRASERTLADRIR